MNTQTPIPASVMNGAPDWMTLPFLLIGLGIIMGLVILFWGASLATRRRNARKELEERGEAHYANEPMPVHREVPTAPPVAPSPPPMADTPAPATIPSPEPLPQFEATTEPEAEPQVEPLADQPIAAAGPLDASPASLAASDPAPEPAPDDLTRMKGVGPRLAEQLNMLGVTSFAQIAALSPEEAAALDAKLGNFQGRLHRDRWIEQAGFLANGDVAGYEAQFGKL